MALYVTSGGETIDGIAWEFYGDTRGRTEALLDANPDLALQDAHLPAGMRIELPDRSQLQVQTGFALWSDDA